MIFRASLALPPPALLLLRPRACPELAAVDAGTFGLLRPPGHPGTGSGVFLEPNLTGQPPVTCGSCGPRSSARGRAFGRHGAPIQRLAPITPIPKTRALRILVVYCSIDMPAGAPRRVPMLYVETAGLGTNSGASLRKPVNELAERLGSALDSALSAVAAASAGML